MGLKALCDSVHEKTERMVEHFRALSELRQAVSHLIGVLEVNSDEDPLLGTTNLIIDIAREAKQAGVTPPVSHQYTGGDWCMVVRTPTGDSIHEWPFGPHYQWRLNKKARFPKKLYLDHQREIRASVLRHLRLWEVWFDKKHGGQPATATTPLTANRGTHGSRKEKRQRISREEANFRAREALKNPKLRSVRKLAEAIGCSEGLVAQLPAWRAYQEELERCGEKKVRAPKAVGLTDAVNANAGQDDPELERLIAEHQADFEESPLVSHARKRRRRSKV